MQRSLKKIGNTIFGNNIVKDIVTLVSGNVGGYIINFFSLVVIGRVYSQEQLGEYELIISTASIILGICQLALLMVIMIPEEDSVARRISKIIAYTTGVATIVIGLIGLISYPKIRIIETKSNYVVMVLLFLIYIIAFNIRNIYYSYANREKQYKVLFWNPIILAIVNSIVSIVLGIIGYGTMGYLVGTISGQIVTTLFMARKIRPFNSKDTFQELFFTLKQYKEYPLVMMPANFIQSLANQLPIQSLGRIFNLSVLGGYTMAIKILNIPITIVSQAINRIYYRNLVECIHKREDTGKLAYEFVKNGLIVLSVPMGVLMVFGDFILATLLGEKWRTAGTYILILGIQYILQFCTSCLSGSLVAMGKQKVELRYGLFKLIWYMLLFMVVAELGVGVIKTIIMYTFWACIERITSLTVTLHYTKSNIVQFLRFLITYLIIIGISVYGLYWIRVCIL